MHIIKYMLSFIIHEKIGYFSVAIVEKNTMLSVDVDII